MPCHNVTSPPPPPFPLSLRRISSRVVCDEFNSYKSPFASEAQKMFPNCFQAQPQASSLAPQRAGDVQCPLGKQLRTMFGNAASADLTMCLVTSHRVLALSRD